MKDFLNKHGFYFGIFFCIVVFLCLAFKNPFSERSLIPNLEPYPDSLHYSYPSWNLINGKDFKMESEGLTVRTSVPPSYGVYLLPFLAIFKDIRVFYFANIILALISIVFFFLIVKEIFNNSFIAFFLGGILVTSYYFYLLPQFLMAENITMTVSLILFFVLLKPISTKNIVLFSVLNAIFILIKISNISVFLSFIFLYFVKILKDKNKSSLIKFILISIFTNGMVLWWVISSGMFKIGEEVVKTSAAFSFSYLKDNFIYYLRAITGSNARFIWMPERFITKDLVVLSGLGLILAMFQKKGRHLVFILLTLVFPLLLFMGCFYFPDTRYINLIYPLILIPIGFVVDKIKNKRFLFAFILIFGICDLGLVSVKANFEPKIITLKKQIGLNFRHAEQPWNYLAVKNFNNYFQEKKGNVYLATFLPPFYVDYFKNGNYKYLPISSNQAFGEYNSQLCPKGIMDCYQKILDEDKDLYISNYYLSNEVVSWGKEWKEIEKYFILNKVSEGCFGVCNIYKVENLK